MSVLGFEVTNCEEFCDSPVTGSSLPLRCTKQSVIIKFLFFLFYNGVLWALGHVGHSFSRDDIFFFDIGDLKRNKKMKVRNTLLELYSPNQVFQGNSDQTSVVTEMFHSRVLAKFIKISPTDWHNHISMRFELLGCPGMLLYNEYYSVIGPFTNIGIKKGGA